MRAGRETEVHRLRLRDRARIDEGLDEEFHRLMDPAVERLVERASPDTHLILPVLEGRRASDVHEVQFHRRGVVSDIKESARGWDGDNPPNVVKLEHGEKPPAHREERERAA